MPGHDDEPISQTPTLVPDSPCLACGGSGIVKAASEQLATYCACPDGARLKSASEHRLPTIEAERTSRRLRMTPPPFQVVRKPEPRTCANCAARDAYLDQQCRSCIGTRILENGSNWRAE